MASAEETKHLITDLTTNPNRQLRSSKKPPRDVEIDTEDDTDNEAALVYHDDNGVRNDDPLIIPNPENHEESGNREREEKITYESKENEPMQVTAVLRGQRKKRKIKPSEFSGYRERNCYFGGQRQVP